MPPPIFVDKEMIAALLPMRDCIEVMETMFRSLAAGECLQPLRSLMWLPDHSGLLGMMPAYAGPTSPSAFTSPTRASSSPNPRATPAILGIKIITIFHANHAANLPSHQGIVALFDAHTGAPLAILDAETITAIRTAAASALATRLLSRPNSATLAILGTGEQAERHAESICIVRPIQKIHLWGRNPDHAAALAQKLSASHNLPVIPTPDAATAVKTADIICTVTSSREPILQGDDIPPGAHINAVGSCTPTARELDSSAVCRSRLYTDRYESLFNEAGDFRIPKQEGRITDDHVIGEIAEVLTGAKPGRTADHEITLFKSLGIGAEDLFAAHHVFTGL
jgi:alanine dehydrogenase